MSWADMFMVRRAARAIVIRLSRDCPMCRFPMYFRAAQCELSQDEDHWWCPECDAHYGCDRCGKEWPTTTSRSAVDNALICSGCKVKETETQWRSTVRKDAAEANVKRRRKASAGSGASRR